MAESKAVTALDTDPAVFLKKLGGKPGHRVLLVRAPPVFVAHLAGAPVTVVEAPCLQPDARADVLVLWLRGDDDLDAVFAQAERAIPPEGAVWVVIPRKATPKGKAFRYDFATVQAAGLRTSLVDNKELKFTEDEYGVRFVIRRERRGPSGDA